MTTLIKYSSPTGPAGRRTAIYHIWFDYNFTNCNFTTTIELHRRP